MAAVAAAWSGYQSSLWNGVQAEHYTKAGALRAMATAESTLAGQDVLHDVINFNAWAEAAQAQDWKKAIFYERRFRPEFQVAFNDWMRTDPFDDLEGAGTVTPSLGSPTGASPPSPTFMPSYQLGHRTHAAELVGQANVQFARGQRANNVSDYYVLITVLMAVALFFAAVADRFDWIKVRVGVLVAGYAIVALGVVLMLRLPATSIG